MAIAAMYLKMSGVTGESLADGHVGDIDLVSWGWGVQSAPHTLSDGSPRGASSFHAMNLGGSVQEVRKFPQSGARSGEKSTD